MKLKCRINEQDFDKIVVGATFSEEYNETLDSGSIIIDHVPKMSIKPYDDVYIWNADEQFLGYFNIGDEIYLDEMDSTVTATFAWINELNPVFAPVESAVSIKDNNEWFYINGTIIDIYKYLVIDNPIEILRHNRYRLDTTNYPIIFKVSFSVTLERSRRAIRLSGYYELSDNAREVISTNLSAITLKKYSGYTQDVVLPASLQFNLKTEDYPFLPFRNTHRKAPKVGSMCLSKKANATFVANDHIGTQTILPIVINDIEVNDTDRYEYIYLYNDNAMATSTLTITNLDSDRLEEMHNLVLGSQIEGRKTELKLASITNNIDETKTLRFEVKYDYNSTSNPNTQYRTFHLNYVMTYNAEQSKWISSATRLVLLDEDNEEYSRFVLDSLTCNYDDAYIVIQTAQTLPRFFKHMLVDSYSSEMIDLDEQNYKYKIDLMSETKGLEKKVLPNISITQPIVGEKRTILYYLNQYVNLYSPKVKMSIGNGKWKYTNKYRLDSRTVSQADGLDEYLGTPLSVIFDKHIYAPELSLTAPTLRDVLSSLMIVKDCIPVVKNGIIYAMDISKDHGTFSVSNKHISFINESLNSDNYSTAYRREYEGAISQKNTAHRVEFLGFRNKEDALLTLDNMYVETQFPIYKINKLYMCYYKKITISDLETNQSSERLILVKQDISSLVLENAVRNTLPADWTKYNGNIASFEDMSKYKILTVGYDIGSTKITGWGEKYKYINDLLGWTNTTNTYIETMIDKVDYFLPFGIGYEQFLNGNEMVSGSTSWRDCIVSPAVSTVEGSNIATKLKTIFFQIDYIGMYSGAIVHTKDNTDEEEYETSDNCSSSLSILEVDGLFEKEKMNRLANPVVSFIGRYDDYTQMDTTYNNKLGSKFKDDIVIYHRQYQFYDDCLICNFVGSYDYVLKNYFTTVFAKYRTYSYASYNASINRKENDRYDVILSPDVLYFDNESLTILTPESLLSAFSGTLIDDTLSFDFPQQINGAFLSFDNGDEYFSDVNVFNCGYSLCFNTKTFDPFTAGIYISTINCFDDSEHTNYVGSAQDWYTMPVNSKSDGFLQNIGFFFGHFNEEDIVKNNISWTNQSSVDDLYEDLLKLPLKNRTPTFSFGKIYNYCKDNKENIDYTLQYELVNYDKDGVLMSEWIMKLTDFNNYIKISKEQNIPDKGHSALTYQVFFSSVYQGNSPQYGIGPNGDLYSQSIVIRINDNDISYLAPGLTTYGSTGLQYHSQFIQYALVWMSWDDYYTTIILRSIERIDAEGNLYLKVDFINKDYYSATDIIENQTLIVKQKTETLKFTKITGGVSGYTDYWYMGQTLDFGGNCQWCSSNGKYISVSGENWNENLNDSTADMKYYGFSLSDASFPPFKYPKTMYLITCDDELEQKMVYAQFKPNALPSNYHVIEPVEADNFDFFSVFNLTYDENQRPCIEYKYNSHLGSGFKSVQYWYYDNDGDGYLHFVFGLNVTPSVTSKKIYVSIVKNRNTKVYNAMHRKIGTIMNYALNKNKTKYIDNEQYYEEDD